MTGVSFLRWKSNTNASQKTPSRRTAARGPWNECTWGNPYHKLDWQGGCGAFPGTHASEKLKGNHNALGMRSGNCLNMRVSNCSGIKRVRTWNANIVGIKGEKIWHTTHNDWKWKQNPNPTLRLRLEIMWKTASFIPQCHSQLVCVSHPNREDKTVSFKIHLGMEKEHLIPVSQDLSHRWTKVTSLRR